MENKRGIKVDRIVTSYEMFIRCHGEIVDDAPYKTDEHRLARQIPQQILVSAGIND